MRPVSCSDRVSRQGPHSKKKTGLDASDTHWALMEKSGEVFFPWHVQLTRGSRTLTATCSGPLSFPDASPTNFWEFVALVVPCV